MEKQALAAFIEELTALVRRTSGHGGEPGFVTFIQDFGSTLNLHVHFHVLALDGVYVRPDGRTPEFRRSRAPTEGEIAALVESAARRIRKLTGRADPDREEQIVAPMMQLVGDDPSESPPKKLKGRIRRVRPPRGHALRRS